MNNFEAMLLARKLRLVLLAIFIAYVAYQHIWWLVAIGVALWALTLWQLKRLRVEIALHQSDR